MRLGLGPIGRNHVIDVLFEVELWHELAAPRENFQKQLPAQRLLGRNVNRFRGGLVFKAHRLVYHSTLGSRVIKKKKKWLKSGPECGLDWHMCATFARQRHELAAPEDTLSEQLNRFYRLSSEKWLKPRPESGLDWQCIESCRSANETEYTIGSCRQQSSICLVNCRFRDSGFGHTAAEREGNNSEGFNDVCQK